MGTFDWYSDITELDGMRGPGGLAAHRLYVLTGAWTGSHGRTGIVPDEIAEEMSAGDHDAISRLLRAGLWEKCEGGYRMLRGPSVDPDLPLPLWRYSDDNLGGRLFAVDPTPNN